MSAETFLKPEFTVDVTATKASDTKPPHVMYVIVVNWNTTHSWSITRRFSEFEDLRSKLSEFISILPNLPNKTVWGSSKNLDPTFIEQRRQQLNDWLQKIIPVEFVHKSSIFAHFLGVAENVSPEAITPFAPNEIKTIHNPEFGVNEVIYYEKHLTLLCANEDTKILSKIDSKLSSIRLPWDKKTSADSRSKPHVPPMGSLGCWQVNASGNWVFKSVIYYPSGVSAIVLVEDQPNSSAHQIWVGLDNGSIFGYSCTQTFADIKQIKEETAHTARVTKLGYSPARGLLFSISSDKNLAVFNLKEMRITNVTPVGTSGLLSMDMDQANERLFIGNATQQIFIYTYGNYPQTPVLLHTLHGHTGEIRSLSYTPTMDLLVSGGGDYLSGLWNIYPSAGVESGRSKLVKWLQNGPQKKIKAVVYAPSLKQVFTGVAGGWICVWHAESGHLSYVVKVHTSLVTSLIWLDSVRILITASHDEHVKFWRFGASDASATSVTPTTSTASTNTQRTVVNIQSTEAKAPPTPTVTESITPQVAPNTANTTISRPSQSSSAAPKFFSPRSASASTTSSTSTAAAPAPAAKSPPLAKSAPASAKPASTFFTPSAPRELPPSPKSSPQVKPIVSPAPIISNTTSSSSNHSEPVSQPSVPISTTFNEPVKTKAALAEDHAFFSNLATTTTTTAADEEDDMF